MAYSRRACCAVLLVLLATAPGLLAQPCAPTVDWGVYCESPSACGPPGYVTGDCNGGFDDGAAPYGTCYEPPAPAADLWVISTGALFLQRDNSSHHTFSYDDPNEELQYLNQRDADFGFAPGYEVRLTRFDACAQRGVELLYWQLFPSEEMATVLGTDLAGNLSAILNYSQLDYNGATADNYTNNASAHRLRRKMDLHNVESNHICSVTQGCGCTTLSSLVGFRLLRFDEGLQFASDPNDTMFTYETDELYYDIDAQNTLIGAQLGGYACQQIGRRWSMTTGAKVGVYANFAEAQSRIGGAAGTATINNGAFNGQMWRVSSEKTDLAMVAELSLGVVYQPTPCWRLAADYRVLGVSGVALPANQTYPDLRGINDVQILQSSASLLLHGGFLGVERVF